MKYLPILFLGFLFLGCGKDSPNPPETALLSFPLQNSECTTGTSLNATTSQVAFIWQTARYTTIYDLKVTNIFTGISVNVSTQALTASLPLLKGIPYKWTVTSRNTSTQEVAVSAEWFFYNAGSETTYAPFPAQIIAPESGTTVTRDINNEITLSWSGADVDNDIQGYSVYLDTLSPPQNLEASPSVSLSSVKASVLPGTIYYWRITTIDREGNTSDSGVYSFRVLR